MKVSIALATYNGERWLREQLDSLASQTLRPYELVVSDDQSTDRTVEVVKEFAAASPFPVRVAPNGVRLGFADNFINALRYCTGDVIAFCDQDDVWSASKLERCVAAMRSDPSITLVHHDSEEVDSDLRPLGIIGRPNGSPIRGWRIGDCTVVHVKLMGCCMLVLRRVVDALLNCWPEAHLSYVISTQSRGALGHDQATLDVASALGTVVYLPAALIHHRRHQQNTWSADLLPHNSKPQGFSARATALCEYAQVQSVTASMYAEMAQRAEAKGHGALASHLLRASNRDSNCGRFCAARADLYCASSRLSRLRRFRTMVRGGIYRGIGSELVGMRSAFKDLSFALLGPVVPQFLENVRDTLHLNLNPRSN